MRHTYLLLISIFFFSFSLHAQRYEWIQTFNNQGSSLDDKQIAVFGNNVIVTGRFQNTISFGSTVLTTNNSSINLYIANYDTLGNFQWAIKGGGVNAGFDDIKGVEVDDFGNIYVIGTFTEVANWGNLTLTKNSPNSSINSREGFIVKIDGQGVAQWIRGIYGLSNSISFDGLTFISTVDSSVYVGGGYNQNIQIAGNPTILSPGTGSPLGPATFVARFDLKFFACLFRCGIRIKYISV